MSILRQYDLHLSGEIEDIRMSSIVQPQNVLRSKTNDMRELADSIKRIGLLQPIVVRITSSRGFEIVAGNRRYNACRLLGWRKISCKIVELDDKAAFEVGLVENVQRQTLDPIEEAFAFKKYVDEFGWGGISELAEKLSKSPRYVCRRMKLLELPQDVLDLISESEVHVSTAEELLSIKNKNRQSQLATLIQKRHISSRKARMIVKQECEESIYCNLMYSNMYDK